MCGARVNFLTDSFSSKKQGRFKKKKVRKEIGDFGQNIFTVCMWVGGSNLGGGGVLSIHGVCEGVGSFL